LIYAAIVAAWAAYLVPLWLRRHDEAAASRSADRFSTAMRVLARRQPNGRQASTAIEEPEYTDGPVRPGWRVGAADGGSELAPATRRRRTLVVLLAVTTGLAVPVVLQLVPAWTLAVPGGIVLLFLVASVRAGQRERAWDDLVYERIRQAEEQAAAEAELAASAELEPVVAYLPEEDYPLLPADDEDSWEPRDVPLPTYLDKPRAPRTVRTVELGEPGTWSSGRLTEPGAEEAGGSGTESEADQPAEADQTDHTDHQRAVGD
jgi:hypothetical protein